MSELSPSEAAKLARDIYLAQDPSTLAIFLARKDFCVNKKNKVHLKAEVGTRLINTKDGFGVCAIGGDTNKNQIFLIFRGTTMANYKADVFTDARIGIHLGLPLNAQIDAGIRHENSERCKGSYSSNNANGVGSHSRKNDTKCP